MIQFQSNIQRDQQTQRHALSSENAKRFDSAVKQLREKSDFAALGAIFTLGELSKQDGFYWPSVALINAYLRQETQVPHADSNRAVIVSSLNMLSQRDWRYRDGEPSPLDFSSLSLKGLLFSEPRLWGSNFRFTDLSGAILPGAKMEGTDFHCANFEGANFQESSLYNTTGATELGPKLSSANFRNANLSNVIFKRNEYHFVDVENACFEGATLTGADISGFDLDKVTGLTPEKIQTAKVRPDVPATYSSKPCQSYRDLCSQAQR
jgi:uncharacterized protein YjbI with pentapeptide repeats